MIVRPQRSVTRFFIPLIDVLILLFSIFLLMPFVKPGSPEPALPPADPRHAQLPTDVQQLQDELMNLRRVAQQLRQQRANLNDRLSVKVLEIDSATGKLFETTPEGRLEVGSDTEARRIILRQKSIAGARDVFILILFPRELTGFPLRKQVDEYRRWFQDVPVGFDNPRGSQ
ncbi:MAG: hypothetical protein ACRCZF_01250 [Gemmataceae bacterium]